MMDHAQNKLIYHEINQVVINIGPFLILDFNPENHSLDKYQICRKPAGLT